VQFGSVAFDRRHIETGLSIVIFSGFPRLHTQSL
jgi:hypothetical protein